MNTIHTLSVIKYQGSHSCPRCGQTAKLIVDIEEKEPQLSKKGNLQYYCPWCETRFSVDQHGNIVHVWQLPLLDCTRQSWFLKKGEIVRQGKAPVRSW